MPKINSILTKLRFIKYSTIWALIFFYSLMLGVIFQLILLPNFFPSIHAGNGLLSGGDWVGYHAIAKELSTKIKTYGWTTWTIAPYGQTAAGIAAIFYVLITQEPFSLLPIYSAILATSSIILIDISNQLIKDKSLAIISIIPFISFPSSIIIYDQIGKDSFFIFGLYLFIYSMILSFKQIYDFHGLIKQIKLILLFFSIGIFFMWLVRSYSIIIIKNMLYIYSFIYTILIIKNKFKILIFTKLFIFPLLIFIVTSIPLDKFDLRGTVQNFSTIESEKTGKGQNAQGASAVLPNAASAVFPSVQNNAAIKNPSNLEMEWHGSMFAKDSWEKSNWLPGKVNDIFLNIAILRDGYLHGYELTVNTTYKNTGSMIDVDEHLTSVWAFIAYFPRALQIAFFAPFPVDWFRDLKSNVGNSRIINLVVALEMMVSYCCLAIFPIACFKLWRNPLFFIPVLFFLFLLITYTYATPNLGTLYRLRYGFYMPIVTISLGYGLYLLKNKFKKVYVKA
jgi:putative peptidoglycan lipid II flippase